MAELTVGAIGIVVVTICIALHYEVMCLCTALVARLKRGYGRRSIMLVVGLLVLAHVIEVWIFAGTYYGLIHVDWLDTKLVFGDGVEIQGLLDVVYLSVTVFTTLGFGDIVPEGALRVLVGAEALAGLSLVTWSASFTFLQMQRGWDAGSGTA